MDSKSSLLQILALVLELTQSYAGVAHFMQVTTTTTTTNPVKDLGYACKFPYGDHSVAVDKAAGQWTKKVAMLPDGTAMGVNSSTSGHCNGSVIPNFTTGFHGKKNQSCNNESGKFFTYFFGATWIGRKSFRRLKNRVQVVKPPKGIAGVNRQLYQLWTIGVQGGFDTLQNFNHVVNHCAFESRVYSVNNTGFFTMLHRGRDEQHETFLGTNPDGGNDADSWLLTTGLTDLGTAYPMYINSSSPGWLDSDYSMDNTTQWTTNVSQEHTFANLFTWNNTLRKNLLLDKMVDQNVIKKGSGNYKSIEDNLWLWVLSPYESGSVDEAPQRVSQIIDFWPEEDIAVEDMQVWSEEHDEPCDNTGSCFHQSVDFYGGLETSGELWDYNLFVNYTVFFDWVDEQPASHPYYPLRMCVKALYQSRVEGSNKSIKYDATTKAWSFKMTFASRNLTDCQDDHYARLCKKHSYVWCGNYTHSTMVQELASRS